MAKGQVRLLFSLVGQDKLSSAIEKSRNSVDRFADTSTKAGKRKHVVREPSPAPSLSDTDSETEVSGNEEENDDVFKEDSFSMVPTNTKLADSWGQISRQTVGMIMLPTQGRTLIGYGHRPQGVKDLDNEGKTVRGVRIGAPGFIRYCFIINKECN